MVVPSAKRVQDEATSDVGPSQVLRQSRWYWKSWLLAMMAFALAMITPTALVMVMITANGQMGSNN